MMNTLKFTKMQGIGNDFMVIDGISQRFDLSPEDIKKLSHRQLGVGFDQLLLVEPPRKKGSDFSYRIFNADGNEVEQCGNGARCIARFAQKKKIVQREEMVADTIKGIIKLKSRYYSDVSADMGVPQIEEDYIKHVTVEDTTYELTCVSMGNPHGVIMLDSLDNLDVDTIGAAINADPQFPEGINVGFMRLIHGSSVWLRVYERGVGETLGCGSGACAAMVAGRIHNLLNDCAQVDLPGGYLHILWPGRDSTLHMTGPAEIVYEGEIQSEQRY